MIKKNKKQIRAECDAYWPVKGAVFCFLFVFFLTVAYNINEFVRMFFRQTTKMIDTFLMWDDKYDKQKEFVAIVT